MIKKLKKWQTIEIDWVDSCHLSGWMKDNLEWYKEDLEHKTIGYFLKETKYSIAVVQSRKAETKIENTMIDAMMEIPKVAVNKIRILR